MKSYLSNSSFYVKITTLATVTALAIASISLILMNGSYGLFGGIALALLIIGTTVYFYLNSLHRIILDEESIVLKKKVGQIKIQKPEILEISRLEFSNLTMTFGSKGVFGFIGTTMDNSESLVKDRRKMIQVKTKDKNYVFSSDRPDELITEVKNALQQRL